jgi:NAD(P)H-hydrate epimerase
VEAKTDDARAERSLARDSLGEEAVGGRENESLEGGEAVVVDGLLGTGASGAPRDAIAGAIDGIRSMRERGALVVALDLPSGLDATTGTAAGKVVDADITLTFGTVKRGHLVDRDRCGTLVVLDIGLGAHAALDDGAPHLADDAWVAAHVPPIGASAHKGTRKKLVVVGGAEGMAGASILATRAALRSGVGMVKLVVAPESLRAVQESEPLALASEWPEDDSTVDSAICGWADTVVVGPGLGKTAASRALVERILTRWRGPVLLDADALNVFEGDAVALRTLLAGRRAIITPHPGEFARLFSSTMDQVLAERFDVGVGAAHALGAVVVLKGVPTVITSPDGDRMVSAAGTPVLATAGSGDLLSGVAGTLLAQCDDPFVAATAAAWVHGRAAERAASFVRGATLADVLGALREGWSSTVAPRRYPVLAELPAVGEPSRR